MKKFLDKYLFCNFRWQLLASIVTVLFVSILLSCVKYQLMNVDNKLLQTWIWGFRQVSSPFASISSLEALSSMQFGFPLFMLLGLLIVSWFISVAVYSFITGAIVNAFRNRQQMINEGSIRYSFKGHGLIIGWNIQGLAVVRQFLSHDDIKEILIVSGLRTQDIRNELKLSLTPKELGRIFIYGENIHLESTLKSLCVEWGKIVVVLGDQNGTDNNGGNLRIVAKLSEHIASIEAGKKREGKIKLYLHIEDNALYIQSRNLELPSVADSVFDVEIYNYHESWAWQCWSARKGKDPDGDYLPIRFKREAKRAELFVIGATPMGVAFVNYAMPLMTYGVDKQRNRITLFDTKPDGACFLPKREMLAALPEVEVRFIQKSGVSDDANELMLEAVRREDTAVTIVIAIENPDEAAEAYLQLSNSLRRQNISVLLCQATDRANCIDKRYLQTGGDNATLRYFGMTDCIPWLNSERQIMGQAVNFYYSMLDKLPAGDDPQIITMAPSLWDASEADKQWKSMERWRKWSSINSGDSFKEKAFVFSSSPITPEVCKAMRHAEHNRWWTERILDGWIFGERDNNKFIHNNMVPFDKLDSATSDKDKINIAAMAKHGFLR